jgi:mannosyltransferase OCH1-like enzyme
VIPKVLHQIWLGPDPFPPEYAGYQKTWRRLHPGWDFRFWTEESLPAGLRPEVYELLRQPAERADILRLEVLCLDGGVYVDADLECLRSIDPLLDGVSFFLGALDSGRVSNAIIGSVSGHPLLMRALEDLRPRSTYGPVDREGTGPLLLERLRGDFSDVTVFEPEVLYETSRDRAVYAFHHSARSWKDAAALRADVARAERARASARDELARVQKRYELAQRELAALGGGGLGRLRGAGLRLRRLAVRRVPDKVRRVFRMPGPPGPAPLQ